MGQAALYPRALVINGDALNQGLGTGTTVANLFAGWPPDKLAQIYLNRNQGYCANCASDAASMLLRRRFADINI